MLREGKISNCTWGRELVKQYIEDAIELVRSTLARGNWDNSVEAARRLTLQYIVKAAERSILEYEPVLHEEVMNTLGNLWFALLPYMPPPQRHQFRRLIARIRKIIGSITSGGGRGFQSAVDNDVDQGTFSNILASGGARGAAFSGHCLLPQPTKETQHQKRQYNSGGSLAVSFRCALEFAKLDLSPEALAAQGHQETQKKLAALLVSDVYECDAYICLWKVSEVLAGLKGFQALCQEFRLKALDAEMWRCMLLEEQESRQRGEHSSDEDDDDHDIYDSEEEEKEGGNEGDDECCNSDDGGRLSVNKVAAIPGITSLKNMPMIHHHRSVTCQSPCKSGLYELLSPPPVYPPYDARNHSEINLGPMQALISGSHRSAKPMKIVNTTSPLSSKLTSVRRSSVHEGENKNSAGQPDRWCTKAALEDGETDNFMEFMSLHQHEYRRVVTPDFILRVWTFLEAFDSQITHVVSKGPESKSGVSFSISTSNLLFVRARPFLYRVATVIPAGQLNDYLGLMSDKFGYSGTLLLIKPLIVEEQDFHSTRRVRQVLEWAVDYEQGLQLDCFSRLILPHLRSRTQLELLARRTIAHGIRSFSIIDRALARVPSKSYEGLAVDLCRQAVQHLCPVKCPAALLVLRALQGMPSLGLYLKCRACFSDPLPMLVRPLLQKLDPLGELSIGIRLVEGIVQSAVNSIMASVDTSLRLCESERLAKANRWLEFALAGVRGGQFPPSVLDRLFSHQEFLLAALGPPSPEPKSAEAVVRCFSKLAELSQTMHGLLGPLQIIMRTYDSLLHKSEIAKAAKNKGIEVDVSVGEYGYRCFKATARRT